MNTTVRISPLLLDDLQQVMKIEPLCFGTNHWSRSSFINELNNPAGSYFAARSTNQELLGYAGFWQVLEEAHLTTLAVHPDYRRQHIGEQLLWHVINAAYHIGAQWIMLEVRASNDAAQALYRKYGFKECGKRPHYYHDNNEDALVLWTGNIRTPDYRQILQLNPNVAAAVG